jgi:hypothetical protein
MADEAFALSPISARASLPSEEDYEAIREAFMETSRGRWFLGEYAKRNRNADTRMVLDAVARIEESLAAHRQAATDSGLAEALAAIGRAVEEARAAASAALDSLALQENLAPVRKGARVIREISWRWREIGADARICDLIDSQVSAIEGACGRLSSLDPGGALSAAFDLIQQRIAEFDESDAAAPQAAEEAMPSPSPARSDETPTAVLEMVQPVSTADPAEAVTGMPAEAVVVTPEVVAARAEVADLSVEAADMPAAAVDVTPEAGDENPEATDPYDEALLDMVALEMGAPDPSDTDAAFDAEDYDIHISEPPADPEIVAERAEPMVAPAQPPTTQPSQQPSLEVSLGSTLIANGIVRRPHATLLDPLAPIRRMSQAEKIAFFS